MKSYEGRGRRRRTQEPTLGDKWKAIQSGKWRETRRLPHPTAGQNGNHKRGANEGRQGSSRSWRETNEGRCRETRRQRHDHFAILAIGQHNHWEVRTPIASSYLGNEGRQMKAGAAKSRPECRETNEGGQMKGDKGRETNEGRGSQEQARMEITKGVKGRETNEGRSSQEQARMEITKGDKGRETNEGRSSQEQARMEITKGDKGRETNEGRSSQEQAKIEIMQGDKWRETRWQRQGFWGSATQSWEVRTPIASSYLGNKGVCYKMRTYPPPEHTCWKYCLWIRLEKLHIFRHPYTEGLRAMSLRGWVL